MQNILINTEHNQSEEKNAHCTTPGKKKKKRVIINEPLHVHICSKPVNCRGYSKRIISIFKLSDLWICRTVFYLFILWSMIYVFIMCAHSVL